MTRVYGCGVCDKTTYGTKAAGDRLLLLPCLHVCCVECIPSAGHSNEQPAGNKVVKTLTHETGIFACPLCGFVVRTNDSGKAGDLKMAPRFMFRSGGGGDLLETENEAENEDGDSRIEHVESLTNGHSTGGDVSAEEAETSSSADSDEMKSQGKVFQGVSVETHPTCRTCSECDVIISSQTSGYCNTCDSVVCGDCLVSHHDGHSTSEMRTFVGNKKEYIAKLHEALLKKRERHIGRISCINRVKENLSELKEDVRKEILQRTEYLHEIIERRKARLLNELEEVYSVHVDSYDTSSEQMTRQVTQFQTACDFAEDLVEQTDQGSEDDLLDYHASLTNHSLHLLHQIPEPAVNILTLKLDVPESGREQASLEHLFGSLMQGAIRCGNADLSASFHVDMKWPTSIAITRGKEMVIGGKTGAFEAQGRVLMFNKLGHVYQNAILDRGVVPLDIKAEPDGGMLMSTSNGQLLRMSTTGRKLQCWEGCFRGSGQFGVFSDGSFVVSSLEDSAFHFFGVKGERLRSLPTPRLTSQSTDDVMIRPHAMTVNSNDEVVVTDVKNRQVILVEKSGKMLLQYGSHDQETENLNHKNSKTATDNCHDEGTTNSNIRSDNNNGPNSNQYTADNKVPGMELKCPSAVCCDPFNNILVADFTGDNVHLVSRTGRFLGYLLTRDNGLSCPNCLALNQDGHLLVGQYGGDVLVYQYLSYVRHA